jgi:hypothetical protein
MKSNSYTIAAAMTCFVIAFAALSSHAAEANAGAFRPRVIVTSDFPPKDVVPHHASGPRDHRSDPDDVQSMVRFLMYVNEFDVEGLVASAGTLAGVARKTNMLEVLDLYDQVDENLRKHDPRYPTADKLRAITYQGRDNTWAQPVAKVIGEGKDDEASEAIISIVDKPDPRPVWVCVWGGPCELAQAVWKVQKTRTPAELDKFVSKLRVYMISKQDGSCQWLLDNFPNMFIILQQGSYWGMCWSANGSDPKLANLAWITTNVCEGHGPLGAIYPKQGMHSMGQQEGDTPSFMHLVSAVRGLNNPEQPDQASWGGQYVSRGPSKSHWFETGGLKAVFRWRPVVQQDFAARMDWCVADDFKKGNHNPVPVLNGKTSQDILELTAKPGDSVELSAEGTRDPDGNAIEMRWRICGEDSSLRDAGGISFPANVKLSSDTGTTTKLLVPEVKQPGTIHVILEVQDNGTPSLVAYRRAIVTVKP